MTTRFSARRLPKLAGPAGWNAILPVRVPFPPLEADRTADIVVIGGGFAGLSALRRLLQLDPSLQVVLLEAGQIGEGSAGRNSGFMIDLPHELTSDDYAGGGDDRAQIALNRQAIGFAREAVAECGIDPGYFETSGKVNGAACAAADARNRSYAAHLASLGEGHEMLDAQAMRALTGSRHYVSGLWTPGTVMIQPAGYVRGLAAGLSGRAAIHEGSPVTGFARQGNGWQVETPKGAVSCRSVILATNGHLESFGLMRGRLMHIFLFAAMTEELGPEARAELRGAPRWALTPSDPMGTTVRRIDPGQGGHRIVIRAAAEFRPGMETTEAQMARAARIMQRKFDDRFPMLAGTRMAHRWAGHLCLSMNHVSVCRELEPGLYSACVQNGLGTVRGTLTGIAAAEMAMGVTEGIAPGFAAEPLPSRLPPAPFAQIGATATLRWKEWRARAE
ncbi:FAD-dependent oxidoreductase [Mangrovicoccus sp. HB161399]|uniref:NAD(P)/FAD-dependent oxidoreductase n=1 Tax=Mangrovicoccus sp. HB161399 TaxID=2720392 RepID=UPI001554EAD6